MLWLSSFCTLSVILTRTEAYTTQSPAVTLEGTTDLANTSNHPELNGMPETDMPAMTDQMVTHSGTVMFENYTTVAEVMSGDSGSGSGTEEVFGMTMKEIEDYFRHYHYLGPDVPDEEIALLSQSNMSMALQVATTLFQRRYASYGLVVNGLLDEATVNLMSTPRCGVPDIVNPEDMMKKRKKRYTLSGGRWDRYDLTYKIVKYPQDGDLNKRQVDREIARAFKVWSDVTPLTFTVSASDKVDITILFGARDHGDPYPFDGEGGVLAHAFYPLYGGDSHFDEDEVWTLKTKAGINLFQVAAHEFGHALGLAHSTDPSALMAPFYQGYLPNFKLPQDDVAGIQQKYGPPTTPTPKTVPVKPTDIGPPTQPPTMSPEMSDICTDSRFDAMTTVLDGKTHRLYGFKGKFCFMIENNGGIAPGYPKMISEQWPSLPSDIDAGLFVEPEVNTKWEWNGKAREWELKTYVIMEAATYIFKGTQYWKIENMAILQGYPMPISDWGMQSSIDAAFVWHVNNKKYFIKGDMYYRIEVPQSSSGALGVVADGYPRPLSLWRGVPSSIDAVFQWTNEQIYFMSGQQYYLFDDNEHMVDPGYPRDNKGFWLRCYRYKTSQQSGMTGNDTTTSGAYLNIPHLVLVVSAVILSKL